LITAASANREPSQTAIATSGFRHKAIAAVAARGIAASGRPRARSLWKKGRLMGVTFVCERGSHKVQQRGEAGHPRDDLRRALSEVIADRSSLARITSFSAELSSRLE
jgi:hypothetical protein